MVRQVHVLHHCRLLSAESRIWVSQVGLFFLSIQSSHDSSYADCWLPLDPGWVKLNTYSAFRTSTQISGMGGVIRDPHGEVLFTFHEHSSISNIIAAELAALLSGLSHIRRLRHTRMWIKLDALFWQSFTYGHCLGLMFYSISSCMFWLIFIDKLGVRLPHIILPPILRLLWSLSTTCLAVALSHRGWWHQSSHFL